MKLKKLLKVARRFDTLVLKDLDENTLCCTTVDEFKRGIAVPGAKALKQERVVQVQADPATAALVVILGGESK